MVERRINLTSAAVSQRLRALESDLGQSLVARSGKTIQPTPGGLAVLDAARALVADARNLRAIAANGEPAGQLRLGATASALTGILPQVIATLRTRHPVIEYFVQPGSSVDLYHRVVAGDLDAAMIVRPQFSLPKSVSWRSIRQEPLVLITPSTCPVQDPHRIIADLPFIRYDRNQWGGQIVDTYLRTHGLKVRETLELDALDAIAAMVSRGLGVSIVPDWAPPWPEGLHLHKVALPTGGTRETGVIWRHTGARYAAVRAFVRACASV